TGGTARRAAPGSRASSASRGPSGGPARPAWGRTPTAGRPRPPPRRAAATGRRTGREADAAVPTAWRGPSPCAALLGEVRRQTAKGVFARPVVLPGPHGRTGGKKRTGQGEFGPGPGLTALKWVWDIVKGDDGPGGEGFCP